MVSFTEYMVKLRINNKEIISEDGVPVMKAAQKLGFDIPNLCWHDDLDHFTSCMLCLVKDNKNGRLFPSCSVSVTEGMDITTDDEEIFEARQMALELLLSEHVGDCEAPCRIACPAHMNIPVMNRLIAAGNFDEALKIVKKDIALPSVLGRICPAPCEGACHRKTIDEPVSVCLLKRFAGDEGSEPVLPKADKTGFSAAVIGAGPAGLAAAYYMQLRGIQVTLFDSGQKAGGKLRTDISRGILPLDVLDREIEAILNTGVEFIGGKKIDTALFSEMKNSYSVIIIAAGTVTEESETFGLKTTPQGILAAKNTYQTPESNIFAVGNALRSSKLAVRSAGQGKEVAFSVWQYLNKEPLKGEPSIFNSRFGKLLSSEFAEYLKESVTNKRVYPSNGAKSSFPAAEAVTEAERCLHCDCRAVDNCKLRVYADRHNADQRRYKTNERKKITKLNTHPTLIYEPNKCIRCGICVRLTEKYGEKFGFTYIGRGFDVEIGVPFNEEIQNALTETAKMVAGGCPTGAIALKAS
jgi:hypothetical protein